MTLLALGLSKNKVKINCSSAVVFFYFQMEHPVLFLPSVCSKKRFATSTYNILLLVGLPSWSSSDVFTSIIHLLHCIGNADWGLDLRLF